MSPDRQHRIANRSCHGDLAEEFAMKIESPRCC